MDRLMARVGGMRQPRAAPLRPRAAVSAERVLPW
jgi:hypothetical protein